ncbi:EamA family transporter [Candidatus Woesearchaeota archaeon]|nr:EamA family transporter [Candidatus Woesearchaeota archaeon]
MEKKTLAVALMFTTTLLTSAAQMLYKIGVKELSFDAYSLITNFPILFGLLLYGIGAVLMVSAFKLGEVTVLYPIIAASYVWVSILSMAFLGEELSLLRWAGIATIILGIILIGLGSDHGSQPVEKMGVL